MSIKNCIANITEKFLNSDKKNILYHKSDNCFDLCVQELPHNIIDPKNDTLQRQHNCMLFNSILDLATNSLLESVGCFVHSIQPINLKKEDSFLLKQRTRNIHKITFDSYLYENWGTLEKTHVIRYGIPDMFKITTTSRRNKIGILNLQNNTEISNIIAPIFHNSGLEIIEITKLNNIVNIFNQCSFVIEMYEHNVINSLCAIKCGCLVLMPKTGYINNCYPEIIKFDDIQHLISIVKSNHEEIKNDIFTKYNFKNFVDSMNNVLNLINNEVFVL